MICAIHQPNFCPWLPFFKKIAAADVFVLLTEAQFSKAYYQQRFNIEGRMFTLPVVKGDISISKKLYVRPREEWPHIKRSLNGIYNGKRYGEILSVFDDCIYDSLCETNVAIIYRACTLLGIDIKKIRFDIPTDLRENDRNIMLCKLYGADTYLSGTGARKYNDEAKFKEANITLQYQEVSEEEKIPLVEAIRRGVKL